MDTITNLCNEIAEKIPKVYEAGKKEEHYAFWDSYTNPKKHDLDYLFAGQQWTNNLFNPSSVTLKPTRAIRMFARSGIVGDLAQLFEDLGFAIDFSNCVHIDDIFNNTKFIRIGELDFSGATGDTNRVFVNAYTLVTIDKLTVGANTKNFNAWFSGCTALKNIVAEGVIDKDINFSQSPLTPESMISIITHLFDFGFDEHVDDRYTCTIKFSDACWNALNEYSKPPDVMGNPDADWRDYVNYLGWNT